jgi:colanic acid/amylovoran biosynthesis glycosyltransferase
MKIAHVFIQFPNAYQPYNVALVKRQQEAGMVVRTFSFVNTHTASVQVLDIEPRLKKLYYLIRGLAQFKRSRKFGETRGYGFIASCIRYGRLSLLTDWQPDVIHVHHLQVLGDDLVSFLEFVGLPWVISLRGFETGIRPLLSDQENQFVFDRLKRCTAIHAVAEDLKNRAIGFGVPPDRIFVIRRTVEVTAPIKHAELSAPETGFNIVTIGRFNWKKGFVFLLQAVNILVERGLKPHLHVAGSGTEDEKAELYYWRWLLKLSSQVTFHGYLSSEKLDGLLAQAHVYVQPSINEGLPNTLLRVVMNKIPVVASRVDGIPEVVTHEVNGLLVPPGDVEALAQALQRCVFDVSLRNQIAQAEQPHVSTDPTVEVGEYRSMYSKIAHR